MTLILSDNTFDDSPPAPLLDIDPERLFKEARVLRRWGYRDCWPRMEAVIEDDETVGGWLSNDPTHLATKARNLWAELCGREPDNHETYEVHLQGVSETPSENYIFVCFHDGKVYLGRTARQEGANPTWSPTCHDQERNERLASNAVTIAGRS